MMPFNKKKITYLLCLALFFFLFIPGLHGDTLSLSDGTILVGKIIKEDEEKILFNNAYGLFKIRHDQVIHKYITEDYREDIDIHKKLGKSYDEKEIRKNVTAGEKARETFIDEDMRWWNGGIIYLTFSYFATTGKMNTVLPAGLCASLTCEKNLDFLTNWRRHLWMPGARIEAGYMFYDKDPARISGPMAMLGPVWRFNIIKRRYGQAVVSPLTGITFLKIEYEEKEETSNTFLSHLLIGYEYKIGITTFFVQGRYKFIYDRDVAFNGIGGGIGAGVSLW